MLQTIGMALVALGLIGFIWGVFQKLRAGRVADAPLVGTGDAAARGPAVAGPKGAISAQGNVVCQQPLISPVTGTPCLFYELKCTANWKEGEKDKEKEIEHTKVAAQFQIDDGTGPVWIDAREGGDFEPTTSKTETKGGGLLGGITGADIMFGHYKVQPGILSLGTKFTVYERVFPLQQRIYACGKAAEGGGSIAAPGWRQLILNSKSRDEVLSSATKAAKTFLLGGAAAFVVGGALATIGQMTSKPDVETAAASAETASPSETAAPSGTASPTGTAAVGVRPAVARPGAKGTKTATTGATAAATGVKPATTGTPTATTAAPPAATATAKATAAAPPATTPTAKAPTTGPAPAPSPAKK